MSKYLLFLFIFSLFVVGRAFSVDTNVYCPVTGGPPTWAHSDGPALLPSTCYNTAVANTPATGSVVNVTANNATDLQTKLTAAVCGQQITLPAGSTYSGNFTLPAISCPQSNYLWIVSGGVSNLPAEGARFTTTYNGISVYEPQFSPCYSGVTSLAGRPAYGCPGVSGTYTSKMVSPNNSPVLVFTANTSAIRFIGIEFTRTASTGNMSNLIGLGNRNNISYIIFDRCWLHGDENIDETGFAYDTSTISYVGSIDSYYSDFVCVTVTGACTDASAIQGGINVTNSTTETVLKVVNNFIEASGENIGYGGGPANTTPSNFEIRLNLMFKPQTWNPNSLTYNGGVGGNPVITKNLFELKNAQLVLLEGNVFINDWTGFSQPGAGILITPKSQAIGGGGSACLICLVANITIRYNVENSMCNIGQLVVIKDDNGGLSAGGRFWSVHDLISDNLMYADGNCSGVDQWPIVEDTSGFSSTNFQHDVTVNHNTTVVVSGQSPNSALAMSGQQISTGFNQKNIVFTNNVVFPGAQGTVNSIGGGITANCAFGVTHGTNMINACWSPNTFGGNCFIDNALSGTSWPGTNVTSVGNYPAAFVNYNLGNAGNYTLSSNACKGAATDGTDPGANISLTAKVISGQISLFAQPYGVARILLQ